MPLHRFRSTVRLAVIGALVGGIAYPAAAPAQASAAAAQVRAAVIRAVDDAQLLASGPDIGDFPSPPCRATEMVVSYDEPEGFAVGAHVAPLGPPPSASTSSVNGVVVCGAGTYAYVGFTATLVDGAWTVEPVPVISEVEHDEAAGARDLTWAAAPVAPAVPPTVPVTPVPAVPSVPTAVPAPATGPGGAAPLASSFPAGIEGYASYEGQSACDPSPKPGVVAFARYLLNTYPVSRSMGISRGCGVGGRSEHKEGRAFDWGVNVTNPAQRAAATQVIDWVMATDQHGNPHAVARRLGLMYVIWNKQIWTAGRAGGGWRAYTGPSAHTDHVHFSFSWPGARGQTSFFTGVPLDIPGASPVALGTGGGGAAKAKPAATTRARRPATATDGPQPSSSRRGRRGDGRTPSTAVGSDDLTGEPRRRRRPSTDPSSPSTTVPAGDDGGPGDERDGSRRRRRPGPTTTTTVVVGDAHDTTPDVPVQDGQPSSSGRRRRPPTTTTTAPVPAPVATQPAPRHGPTDAAAADARRRDADERARADARQRAQAEERARADARQRAQAEERARADARRQARAEDQARAQARRDARAQQQAARQQQRADAQRARADARASRDRARAEARANRSSRASSGSHGGSGTSTASSG